MAFEGELNSVWRQTARKQLDSLEQLGVLNNDGWGFGYYLAPDSLHFVPVTRRGEPMATNDPRYDRSADEMMSFCRRACIAHVRNASSGPLYGLPNPHPFYRTTTDSSRNLDMLFAHNGTIPTEYLLDLIDPQYKKGNPPDYCPNYLDSDLYFIYLLQTIDTYYTYEIDSCIKMAVRTLALHLHQNNEYAQLNSVLTDGTTLWALRYADVSTHYYTLFYYHPDESNLDTWIVASQPLDTTDGWRELPNYSLTTLKPKENPVIHHFELPQVSKQWPSSFYLEKLAPNICRDEVSIRFFSPDRRSVTVRLYDESGRAVETVFNRSAEIGMNEVRHQLKSLPSGIYFIHLETRTQRMTEKLVIQR